MKFLDIILLRDFLNISERNKFLSLLKYYEKASQCVTKKFLYEDAKQGFFAIESKEAYDEICKALLDKSKDTSPLTREGGRQQALKLLKKLQIEGVKHKWQS